MSTDGSLEALNVIATTRTIRRYADEQIPETDLNAIIWHATRAPSGSNRQP
ncbi:MAG: nitroreductase, partial [Actinobacteria bacterium]|nr:nitroreductase [Actinomycetota bacterium]